MAKKWTDEQLKAIDTKNRNILVSAAAGSGKTAVLVERIINMITGENSTDIDRLVVVTFTKAAAAEMKARIRNRLDDMLDNNEADTNLLKQIALINNAHITTIDSFCLWIIKNHFSEIELDPGFRAADNGEITLLENDVMQELLEDYYTEADEDFINLVEAYGTGRNDQNIEELIKKIYNLARSNPWPSEWYKETLDMYEAPDNSNNRAIADLYESIINSLSDYCRKYEYMIELCQHVDGPVSYLDAINSDYMNIKRILEAPDFDDLSVRIRKTVFDRLSNKKMPDAREDLKEYVKNERNNFKKYINSLISGVFTADIDTLIEDVKANAPMIAMMVKLSNNFAQRMSEQKKDRGIIDFNDMEHLALDILVKNNAGIIEYTRTADELAESFDEILIDEYQDSNQLQEEILTAVSRQRMSDYFNNVYMVGDVKQSIYKFRLACPELFMSKYDNYSSQNDNCKDTAQYNDCEDTSFGGGEQNISSCKIELQKNFRSRSNVLDSTNDVFFRVMNKNFCGIQYDDRQQLNCGLDYPACEDKRNFGQDSEKSTDIVLVDMSGDEDGDGIRAEARYAALRIRELMSEDNAYYVYDADLEDYRRIKYGDIVILTRTLTGWADVLVNELLDCGVPAMADTAQQYFKLREIKVLISLLTCIDNPLQDIPMASVLLSYFGGFTEDELCKIRISGKKYSQKFLIRQMKSIAENEDEDCDYKKCSAFIDKLNALRDKSRIMTIYDLLWEIVYNTGYYDYAGTMPAGAKRQSNIDVLLDRASSFEGTSYSGLFNFLRYIERLQKYDIDITDSQGMGDNGDSVRVMSIHKSKGLEFPVVIVAGLNKQINKMDARSRIVIDKELGIGADYVNLDRKTKTSTIIKGAIARKIVRDGISEEERVLYVAMTRAREKLIMMGNVTDTDKAMTGWNSIADEIRMSGIYSYADCEKIDKFADMVIPVVLTGKEYNKGEFNIKLIGVEEINSLLNKSDIDQTGIQAADESQVGEKTAYGTSPLKELPPYIKDPDADRKVKVTVSELKKMQNEADYEQNAFAADSIKKAVGIMEAEIIKEAAGGVKEADGGTEPEAADEYIPTVPKFISSEEKELVSNERGTAYHRVMECLNYSKAGSTEDIKNEIDRMVREEKLSLKQAECIKLKDIDTFAGSSIGERIKRAYAYGGVKREQPFVFEYDRQLVQGVIDLYFIEDGQLVIVDYKTDRVLRGRAGEDELRRRYSIQLDYYAMALSQITGLKVKEKVIYSFALGRSLTVE